MSCKDIRDLLKFLESKGLLKQINKAVNTKLEIAKKIRETSDTQGPALLFNNVKGYEMSVVGGIFITRQRTLMMLESENDAVIEKFLQAINNPLEPNLVKNGPCQEIQEIDEKVHLNSLPLLHHYKKDAGRYITGGIFIAKHPELEYRNLSIHRMMVKEQNKLGIYIGGPSSHLWQYLESAERLQQPLEVAIAIGVDPFTMISSQLRTALHNYELGIAGRLMGDPVDVVKCKTVDLEVPAKSEIIIEGEIPPNISELEGPVGEYTGHYCDPVKGPIVNVKAITHRSDAIYQAVLTGMPVTENHIIKQIPLEVYLYNYLKAVSPNVKALHLTPGGGCHNHAIISLKQTYPGEAKQVLLASLASKIGLKQVIAVDDDIDVYNPTQVEWAMAFRFQADEDLIVVKGKAGQKLDPSTRSGSGITAAMGLDATIPYGVQFNERIE
jgi:UbiD family decarboxylase